MKVFFLCLTALISSVGKGQATDDLKTLATSSLIRLSISGNSYPIFLNGEEHSSFMVNYGVSRQTQLELQAFYDTYLMSKRFRTSLVDKLYLSDKQYLFSGLDLEMRLVSMK